MSAPNTGQALAKVDRTPPVITTPDEYLDSLRHWRAQGFHVLTPFAQISGLAERHGLIATVVKLDTNASYGEQINGGETYGGAPWLKGKRGDPTEELAPTKAGLRKIAEAGAISTRGERTDPRTIPHYWEVRGIASYRGIDGMTVTREVLMEWDLRDGSERVRGWTAPQKLEGRKHGLRNCDTRAISAAIREFGLKQKYTRAELERPFVIVRVVYQPDMSDPLVRQIVTERAIAGTTTLYPSRSLASASGEVIDAEPVRDSEPRSVGSGRSTPAEAAPQADVPPTEDAVRIVDVKSHSGKSDKGKEWTRFIIVDSNGAEHSTFDAKLAEAADSAKKSGRWVELTEHVDGNYKNLVEIAPAGQQPSLPDMKL